ncbi:C4-dicarboxylate transporter DctA, partial [Azotobacter chroococcum]|nr:C4-dicarboxylate transporter DctA [Azotobacter chroococcum]
GVASVVVAKWVGQLDSEQMQRELASQGKEAAVEAAAEPVLVTEDAARR